MEISQQTTEEPQLFVHPTQLARSCTVIQPVILTRALGVLVYYVIPLRYSKFYTVLWLTVSLLSDQLRYSKIAVKPRHSLEPHSVD
jgi:hypothetical protein